MTTGSQDLAKIRLDNAMLLFEEFVRATIKQPDAATLRGLESRFAERLQIQPSYWSQIKSRSRQIGERLARQFEQLCRKSPGWMDAPHVTSAGPALTSAGSATAATSPVAAVGNDEDAERILPRDADERFIVGLVLTYYRRHPQRARGRLLDLLGEVLVPGPDATSALPPPVSAGKRPLPPTVQDERELWKQEQAAVAPLKKKR